MIPAMKNQSLFIAFSLLLLAGACGKNNKSGGAASPTINPLTPNVSVPLPPNASHSDRASYMFGLINQERQTFDGGVPALVRDPALDAVAADYARDLANRRLRHDEDPCRTIGAYSRCAFALQRISSDNPHEALQVWKRTGSVRGLRRRTMDVGGVAVYQNPSRDPGNRPVLYWVFIAAKRP